MIMAMKNFNGPHPKSNPRPSDLYSGASTNCVNAHPLTGHFTPGKKL
jgi:hypothetical protein